MAVPDEAVTTVVSSKGQVILPKAVRARRNWPAGARLVVEETAEGVLLRPAPLFATTDRAEVFASVKTSRPPLTIEQMDAAVADGVRRRHMRK
jgi:AbrB family looped-hinge helix DNA binding protein